MKQLLFFASAIIIAVSGCAQTSSQSKNAKPVGGNCEGCEAIYEGDVAFDKLSNTATLPDYNEKGPKLEISGIVYQRDGKTPAKDVILYVYHTDQTGHYTPAPDGKGWGKRHGRVRGWMKTDKNGYYHFYTLKPAPYPGTNIPAHIHITLKEPDKNEYYIDEYLFEGDPFLTTAERNRQEKRGGSGIISLDQKKASLPDGQGMLVGKRDIILGLNVPGY